MRIGLLGGMVSVYPLGIPLRSKVCEMPGSGVRPYYTDDFVTLYHGDCGEILPALPASSVRLILTSPPYNLGEGMGDKGGLRVGHAGSKWQQKALRGGYDSHSDNLPYPEYVAWQRRILRKCWRLLDDEGAIFYNHKPRIVKGELRTPLSLIGDLPLRQIVIWDRGSGFNYMGGAYMPKHEWVVILAKPAFHLRDKSASGVGDVWRIPPETNTKHPAPFPLALAQQVLSTTPVGTVLDPFVGSGTTLRAAKDLTRKAIGIEQSEAYCEMIAQRLSQEVLPFGDVA